MKSIKTLFICILFSSSITWSLTNQLNLYIPEFDNLKNEKSLEWLSSGYVDILSKKFNEVDGVRVYGSCLLYTSPSPRDLSTCRMPSYA